MKRHASSLKSFLSLLRQGWTQQLVRARSLDQQHGVLMGCSWIASFDFCLKAQGWSALHRFQQPNSISLEWFATKMEKLPFTLMASLVQLANQKRTRVLFWIPTTYTFCTARVAKTLLVM
jgi:hypothetical protein